jgi:hypothetical protein
LPARQTLALSRQYTFLTFAIFPQAQVSVQFLSIRLCSPCIYKGITLFMLAPMRLFSSNLKILLAFFETEIIFPSSSGMVDISKEQAKFEYMTFSIYDTDLLFMRFLKLLSDSHSLSIYESSFSEIRYFNRIVLW